MESKRTCPEVARGEPSFPSIRHPTAPVGSELVSELVSQESVRNEDQSSAPALRIRADVAGEPRASAACPGRQCPWASPSRSSGTSCRWLGRMTSPSHLAPSRTLWFFREESGFRLHCPPARPDDAPANPVHLSRAYLRRPAARHAALEAETVSLLRGARPSHCTTHPERFYLRLYL